MAEALVIIRTQEPVICAANASEMRPGDTVRMHLDTDNVPGLPAMVTGVVQTPVVPARVIDAETKCPVMGREYLISYDTDDLDGALVELREDDVLSLECLTCCIILSERLDAETAARIANDTVIQNNLDQEVLSRAANDAAEAAARIAADNLLLPRPILRALPPINEGYGERYELDLSLVLGGTGGNATFAFSCTYNVTKVVVIPAAGTAAAIGALIRTALLADATLAAEYTVELVGTSLFVTYIDHAAPPVPGYFSLSAAVGVLDDSLYEWTDPVVRVASGVVAGSTIERVTGRGCIAGAWPAPIRTFMVINGNPTIWQETTPGFILDRLGDVPNRLFIDETDRNIQSETL